MSESSKRQMVEPEMKVHSAIYKGTVTHRRLMPKYHHFEYQVFMMYLDLRELDAVFAQSPLWSREKFGLAQFCRKDFLRPTEVDLDSAVRQRIKKETGEQFSGSIRMLANLRYFGFLINPLVCYYCFDQANKLRYIVAEVTNTPWRERHSYVLRCDPNQSRQRIQFTKQLHVSPFNSMDVDYDWCSSDPGDNLQIYLANHCGGEKQFTANVNLQREPLCSKNLNRTILRYPWMTLKVCAAIYWQAMKLYLKGIPFVPHPKSLIEDKPLRD